MKIIPILFSTMMVQALLEGRKTMTRRIIKSEPSEGMTEGFIGFDGIWRFSKPTAKHPVSHSYDDRKCPYGQVGDVLWVRESYCITNLGYRYAAGGPWTEDEKEMGYVKSYKPSIHMPKSACRIWMEVVSVKVERLQDISEGDAIAEGVKVHPDSGHYIDYYNGGPQVFAGESFKSLWQIINGVESWDSNPWVWVIEFKKCEMPKDFLA